MHYTDKTITIITCNFYPEDTAIGLYTTQFARFLAASGFKVNVITGFPYYPSWKISNEYKDKSTFFEESLDGIKIYRYKQYVPSTIGFFGRVRLMLSFLYGSICNAHNIKETDMVFCIVPFTVSIIPSLLLSRKKKSKLWVHIQDLEFDLAIESGVLKNGLLGGFTKKCLYKLERYLLTKADVLSSISYNMIDKINNKTNTKNCEFFPNWVDVDNINPTGNINHEYINPSKFTLLYSGNIGEKQDWDFFVRFCNIINDGDIEIVIVGDGAYAARLKERCAGFDFVKFYPLVEYTQLASLLCSPDIHFLFQKTDVIDTVMPSKLLGMMASTKVSIVTGNENSEIKQIFEKMSCGVFKSSGNESDVYDQVQYLKNNPAISADMGRNARNFVAQSFSEERIMNSILTKVNNLFC
ncbi:MAG: WcaI family glycosyltransferase [Flavobacterium sp.]